MAEDILEAADRNARIALVAKALTGDLGMSEVIGIVLRQGVAGMGAEGGVVAVIEPDESLLRILAVGYPADWVASFAPLRLEMSAPLTDAARLSTPVWVPNRDECARRFPWLAELTPSHAWAAIPLVAGGVAFGSIGLSFLRPQVFDDPARAFLQTLADIAALALDGSSQRARLAQHADDPEGLVRTCAWCRRIHDGDGWRAADGYFTQRFGVRFTHVICLTCDEGATPILP